LPPDAVLNTRRDLQVSGIPTNPASPIPYNIRCSPIPLLRS
jgi:hypothetical protein